MRAYRKKKSILWAWRNNGDLIDYHFHLKTWLRDNDPKTIIETQMLDNGVVKLGNKLINIGEWIVVNEIGQYFKLPDEAFTENWELDSYAKKI
jgi:hypothetical protein